LADGEVTDRRHPDNRSRAGGSTAGDQAMIRRIVVSGVLMVADAFLLYAIFYAAIILRKILAPYIAPLYVIDVSLQWETALPIAQVGILVGIAIFFFQGLYPGYGLTAVKELERMSASVTLVFFLLAAVFYLNKPFQELPRSVLLLSWGLSLGILPVAHFALRNLLSRFSWYGVPVVVFGDGEWAQQVSQSISNVRRLGWIPQTILPLRDIGKQQPDVQAQVMIIAASINNPIEKYARILNQRFHKVILVREADKFGSLWVEPRDLDGNLGLEYSYHLLHREVIWFKRFVDVLGAIVISLLLGPLLLFLAAVIAIESPGSPFFLQERIGQNRRRFRVIKFRTMSIDAEQQLIRYLRENPQARAEYDKYHKLQHDPRVSRVGKFLRKFSLDEFPQLVNVLRGEMSLVGPRAYLPFELDQMGDYEPVILRVKPGATGWWQVMGRHQKSFQQRLQMDEYYISNWSLWMDIYILMKTVWIVLVGSGA
jgi:Undecaprenyl-phosphate galactose phosphotransferase WbaP